MGFPDGSVVKNPSATQETRVQPLCWKDALEEGRATHSSILAWRIPWTEEPGGLQATGSQKRHGIATKQTTVSAFYFLSQERHRPLAKPEMTKRAPSLPECFWC